MSSYNFGKKETVQYLKKTFPARSTCLDVGPCNGKWFKLLGNHFIMDAVEAWKPYIVKYKLADKYRKLTHTSIVDHNEFDYDVILFGDILEHLTVEDAQKVVAKMYPRCRELVVAVPYKYKQGAMRGNPFEIHMQDDLTPEIFAKRYPGFIPLIENKKYAYYIKDPKFKNRSAK